jgi:hypothetical protein
MTMKNVVFWDVAPKRRFLQEPFGVTSTCSMSPDLACATRTHRHGGQVSDCERLLGALLVRWQPGATHEQDEQEVTDEELGQPGRPGTHGLPPAVRLALPATQTNPCNTSAYPPALVTASVFCDMTTYARLKVSFGPASC